MDTKIIGQGYNIDADTSVAKELIEQFNSKRYDSFTCLVAFASYGGITALTPYILAEKERGVKINIILGIDQKGRADAGSVNRAVTQFCLHYRRKDKSSPLLIHHIGTFFYLKNLIFRIIAI